LECMLVFILKFIQILKLFCFLILYYQLILYFLMFLLIFSQIIQSMLINDLQAPTYIFVTNFFEYFQKFALNQKLIKSNQYKQIDHLYCKSF